MQESTLLESFDHVNIVPFFGVVCDDTTAMEPLYLAMQYVPSGTLQDLIHSERYVEMRSDEGRLPLVTQALALLGLFSALEYLAERNLIHRDVKPANILAVVEEAGNLSSLSSVASSRGTARPISRPITRSIVLAAIVISLGRIEQDIHHMIHRQH
jgi:serine/threonine protein kinase